MREYCPLAPCRPPEVLRPDAYGGISFVTHEAYLRHIEWAHFIAAKNAPAPFVAPERVRRENAA